MTVPFSFMLLPTQDIIFFFFFIFGNLLSKIKHALALICTPLITGDVHSFDKYFFCLLLGAD